MSGSFNFKDWQARFRGKESAPEGEGPTPNQNPNRTPFVEEIKVSGQNLVNEVDRLLREGEVRRLRIKQNDKVLLDLPIAFAAVGALLAPPLAAVGAIAAVVSDCTVEVYRSADAPPPAPKPGPTPKAGPAGPQSPDDLSYR
jgi:hypothetical protein